MSRLFRPASAAAWLLTGLLALLGAWPFETFAQTPSLALAQAWADSARANISRKQATDAQPYIDQSLAVFRAQDDLLDWLQLHRDIAKHYRDKEKNAEKALFWFQAAVQQRWRAPASEAEQNTWAGIQLGIGYTCLQLQGDFIRAREYYEAGRAMLQDTLRLENLYLAEVVLTPLGNIHARFRDYEKALYFLQQAKRICEQQQAWDKAALAANGIGMLYISKQEYPTATRWFRTGLALPQLSAGRRVMLTLNLGLSLLKEGDIDNALRLSTEARYLLEQQPEAFSNAERLDLGADLQDNLGNICEIRGEGLQAAGHFRACIALLTQKFGNPNRREIAQGYLELCELFATGKQPDSVLHYAQTALRCLLPQAGLAGNFAIPSRDLLYAEHTFFLIFEHKIDALVALAAQKPAAEPALLAHALETCDRLLETDAILRKEYSFDESKLYRQLHSRRHAETAQSAAWRLWQLNSQQKWLDRAFQYADQARERLLLESLQSQEYVSGGDAGALAQPLEQARQEIIRLREQVFESSLLPSGAPADTLQAQLYKAQLQFQFLLQTARPAAATGLPAPQFQPAAHLEQVLLPDQALIEYFVGETSVFIYLYGPAIRQGWRLPLPAGWVTTIQDLGRALTDDNLRFLEEDFALFGPNAGRLYDWLLAQPLALLPGTVKSLVLIPDGLLGTVPFEVLGPARASGSYRSFPYLLRRYAVSYAGSVQLLQEQTERARHTRRDLELFAGFAPDYAGRDTQGQAPSRTRAQLIREGRYFLPGAMQEVQEISALLQGKSFLGPAATVAEFHRQASKFRVLHLAMHAEVESRDPLFSKLLFQIPPPDHSAGTAADLSVNDLFQIHLPASLVVLSACNTGVGQLRLGEGILSLSRAFTQAGVPATIMSLWKAPDEATRTLMVAFYTHLKAGQRKDEALRLAKWQYLEQCAEDVSSPYYWAGFAGTGAVAPLFGR
ncbi:MAG: CHAT domain-containing protein [Saprospiraceae bacterium]|nr:CHAT domain-containing protein [Saprospiraceae bacterium]